MIATTDTLATVAPNALAIPVEARDRLAQLKPNQRAKVKTQLIACQLIDRLIEQGKTRQQACRDVARSGQLPGKLSAASLQNRIYKLWEKGGQKPGADGKPVGERFGPRDWRLFVPQWTNGKGNLPADFVAYLAEQFARTTRTDAVAGVVWRLREDWRTGQPIPGYGTRREWCAAQGRPFIDNPTLLRASDIPEGWSEQNLRRYLPKSRAQRTLVQRGEHAAVGHWEDRLVRDRSKLRFLELITFDDVRFDIKVSAPNGKGRYESVYPQGLVAIDVATGLIIGHGMLASVTRTELDADGDTGTRRHLSRRDTKFLLLQVLQRYGIPPYGIRALFEHASACLAKHDEAMLNTFLGDVLTLEQTGLIRAKLMAAGFTEQGGRPNLKGWIESLFRLVHTHINHLPATTGRRYDLDPGDLKDRERYAIKCLNQAVDLGRDPSQLRLDDVMLSLDQFHAVFDDYVTRINWRTNHRLQGFQQVVEYEIAPGRYLRHDDPRAGQLIQPGMQSLPPRMEAPMERAQRLCQGVQFAKVDPATVLPLYLDHTPVKVRRAAITLNNNRIAPGQKLTFQDSESRYWLAEHEGSDLHAFIEADASLVHLVKPTYDATGELADYQYLGAALNQAPVDITDPEAMGREMGRVHHGREETRAAAAAIQAPLNDRLAEARQHNADLLDTDSTQGRAQPPGKPLVEPGVPTGPRTDHIGQQMTQAKAKAREQQARTAKLREADFAAIPHFAHDDDAPSETSPLDDNSILYGDID